MTEVLRTAPALGLLIVLLSCGGGSGGGSNPGNGVTPPGLSAVFSPSSTAPAPNLVRLEQGGGSGELVTVDVVIDGPSSSTDIYGFAFDLVVADPSVARYENGTAAIGSALDLTGCAGEEVLAQTSGDRVIVGVSKLGGCPGNAIGNGEAVVVSLTFRVLKTGMTHLSLEGEPGGQPSALDSNDAVIGSIVFDGAHGTIRGT